MNDESIILQKLASLETDLRLLRQDVHDLKTNGLPSCAVDRLEIELSGGRLTALEARMAKAEVAIGKKELLMALFAAIGVGLGYFIKFLWGKM